MACRSYDCEDAEYALTKGYDADGNVKEGFNAGMPPYLGYAGYPGSDFPKQCGGGYGYGGYGHYGTYGGCATYDHYDIENKNAYSNAHEPGCWSPSGQLPYSMPYHADDATQGCGYCGTPKCSCASQVGGVATPVHGYEGHDEDALFDLGLTNGSGLKGHLALPGFNIHVDFHALLRYAVLILAVSAIAYYLLGLRIR